MSLVYQLLSFPKNPNTIISSISNPKSSFSKYKISSSFHISSPIIQCNLTPSTTTTTTVLDRSENNFTPSIWQHDYIQSLQTGFTQQSSHTDEITKLVDEIKLIFSQISNHLHQLELIDILQRLGVHRHFTTQIKNFLLKAYKADRQKDLYSTALQFRLLRQHGYAVSSDILKGFKDSMDSGEIKSVLCLYEASFLSMEGEIVMDEAGELCRKYLKEFVEKKEDEEMLVLVDHALEVPLHWRTPRVEARWFIHFYQTHHHNMNPTLLKLAILDFNMLQLNHVEDLKHASRWWKRIGFVEKLSFGRDRLVENFLWTVGFAWEPQLGKIRRKMTKVNALITAIDDIYDVYGTFQELQLFTQVVQRWDINEIDILPPYMKTCFNELYAFVKECGLDYLKENGVDITPHLNKVWIELCESYMVEVKWHNDGYRTTLEEYMENAWVSIGSRVIQVHIYHLLENATKMEGNTRLESYYDMIRFSATILRLANDLGSSKVENVICDVPKAVECYMNETKASKVDAQMHINSLIHTMWKKMNKEVNNFRPSNCFVEMSINVARMSMHMYQYGEGHTFQCDRTKNNVMSLVFEHIAPIL